MDYREHKAKLMQDPEFRREYKALRWERRERKYRKRRYGMRVSGRSIKAVLLRLIGKKATP